MRSSKNIETHKITQQELQQLKLLAGGSNDLTYYDLYYKSLDHSMIRFSIASVIKQRIIQVLICFIVVNNCGQSQAVDLTIYNEGGKQNELYNIGGVIGMILLILFADCVFERRWVFLPIFTLVVL